MHPGPLPRGEGGSFAVSLENQWLDLPDNHSRTKRRPMAVPSPWGEKARMRASDKLTQPAHEFPASRSAGLQTRRVDQQPQNRAGSEIGAPVTHSAYPVGFFLCHAQAVAIMSSSFGYLGFQPSSLNALLAAPPIYWRRASSGVEFGVGREAIHGRERHPSVGGADPFSGTNPFP